MQIASRAGSWALFAALLGAWGCGSGGDDPAAPSLTVSGRVVSALNTPVANIAVVVGGQGPVVTDANGYFVVPGVSVPYDAIVFDGPAGSAVVWHGLTRADPTFTYSGPGGPIPPPSSSASVAGTVLGGVGLPIPAPPPEIVTDVRLWVTAGDLFGSGSATPNTVTGNYSVPSLAWPGIAPFELTITALQYAVDAAGLPTMFTGFRQLTTPIANGDVLVGQNLAMGPLATTTISGSTTFPPSVTTLARLVFLTLPGGGFSPLPPDYGGTPNFTLQAPDVAGLKRTLLTYGQTLAGDTVFHLTDDLPAPAPGVAVALPDVAGAVLPVDGVSGVDYTTAFSTTPTTGGVVYFVEFSPNGGGPGPTIELVTTETSFTIPDLSMYGLALPPGAHYDWDVRSQGPAATVDDLAVPPVFSAGLFAGIVTPLPAFGASSPSRSFFFAP